MKEEISKSNMRSLFLKTDGILLAVSMLLAPSSAVASYPTKPVRLIVPFDAGGTSDIVGRIFATELTKRLGKQVVVENRGGAGGTIGTAVAANAPPDGYTLLLTSSAHPINFLVYKKLPYDYWNAFVAVAKIGTGPNVLAVYAGLPVKSVKELIALAKEKPGKLIYSTAGVGGFQHLGSELFCMMAGIELAAVHFKGGGLRKAQGAGHRGCKAHRHSARRADDRGGRCARLRSEQLVGDLRAGRHAALDRR